MFNVTLYLNDQVRKSGELTVNAKRFSTMLISVALVSTFSVDAAANEVRSAPLLLNPFGVDVLNCQIHNRSRRDRDVLVSALRFDGSLAPRMEGGPVAKFTLKKNRTQGVRFETVQGDPLPTVCVWKVQGKSKDYTYSACIVREFDALECIPVQERPEDDDDDDD